jgi:hypothetical protein
MITSPQYHTLYLVSPLCPLFINTATINLINQKAKILNTSLSIYSKYLPENDLRILQVC